MHGERDVKQLLASLEPVQRAGEFVFAVVDDVALLEVVAAEATVREDEGLTAVLRRDEADRRGIAYDYVAAWITLRVHSALDAVGLTAAISTALADAGLSCNVIAGYHHDHLLVPADRAAEAIAVLSDLSRGTER
ncbi:MAG: ACT domain-containing protein [Solirubrobacteraceae bacterium]